MSNAGRLSIVVVFLFVLMVAVMQPTYASELLFSNENPNNVSSNPTGGNPQFTIAKSYRIDAIYTYHMLNASTTPAGHIWLVGVPSQAKYGPWKATISSSYYWAVKPGDTLPPGTYSIHDSNPETWAFNATSKYQGFVQVHGTPQ